MHPSRIGALQKKSPVARRQSQSGSAKKATPRTKASPAAKKPKQQKRQSKSSAAGDDEDEDDGDSEEEVVAKKPGKKVVKKAPAAKGRKKAADKKAEDSGDSDVSDLEDFMAGQRKKQVNRRGVKPGSAASLEKLDESKYIPLNLHAFGVRVLFCHCSCHVDTSERFSWRGLFTTDVYDCVIA